MNTYEQRQIEVVKRITAKAHTLPLLESGLWFLHDIRDNYYYASYVLAAAWNERFSEIQLSPELIHTAEAVMQQVFRLQDQDQTSVTYGHWPLYLAPDPSKAKPNPLPVELMGSLMAYFYKQYQLAMPEALRHSFEQAVRHCYQSRFYNQPMQHYHHHEAKYTAAKLIFGTMFQDQSLLDNGLASLQLTCAYLKQYGMTEYGILPWFWHWVQAYTCAYALVEQPAVKADIKSILDYLWEERAAYYLKGTWVGPHSRGLMHDLPKDQNVLMDYVQFGDFTLQETMPRTEYAGLLFCEAPISAKMTARNRERSAEVKQQFVHWRGQAEKPLHAYTYITSHYSLGGMWEREQEFDNEQHRWDVTLPLTADGTGINTAYFFHPGEGFREGDPRHESACGECLFHKNVVVQLFSFAEQDLEHTTDILGVLPLGEWIQEPRALYGAIGNVHLTVHFLNPYTIKQAQDRIYVTSQGDYNAIVLEVWSLAEAAAHGIRTVDDARNHGEKNRPVFTYKEGELSAAYTSLKGSSLKLASHAQGLRSRSINGTEVDFSDYKRHLMSDSKIHTR